MQRKRHQRKILQERVLDWKTRRMMKRHPSLSHEEARRAAKWAAATYEQALADAKKAAERKFSDMLEVQEQYKEQHGPQKKNGDKKRKK